MLDEVVGTEDDPALGVMEDRVRGRVAGPVQDAQRAVAQRKLGAIRQRTRHGHGGSPAAEAPPCGEQRVANVLGDALLGHHLLGEGVSRVHPLRVPLQPRGEPVECRDVGARALLQDRGQPEVVEVPVRDDDQLEILDAVPVRRERASDLVQRGARVRPGVQQRQRVVLDQVGVDAPDLKRRRDRQAVDPRLGGVLECGARWSGAHDGERMIASTSSRRRSMSCTETSDSRHRRISGSVFDVRTLKCQSS